MFIKCGIRICLQSLLLVRWFYNVFPLSDLACTVCPLPNQFQTKQIEAVGIAAVPLPPPAPPSPTDTLATADSLGPSTVRPPSPAMDEADDDDDDLTEVSRVICEVSIVTVSIFQYPFWNNTLLSRLLHMPFIFV